MPSALGMRQVASVALVGLVLTLGCARWVPAKSYEVQTQSDPQGSYATVLDAVKIKEYKVLSQDDAAKRVRVRAHSDAKSFIDVWVAAGQIRLAPGGALVRDDKVHKSLSIEMGRLEHELKRLATERVVPTTASAVAVAPPVDSTAAPGGAAPSAWSEPAYDPSVWGNGNFTCLPVRVPAEHQGALTLQLTNGEKADLQLSLAYDAGLCRSPAQCKQAGGCPALGIGDAERVSRLAGRLKRGEIGPNAILLDSGKPVATVDLAHHGSIQQALSEIKK